MCDYGAVGAIVVVPLSIPHYMLIRTNSSLPGLFSEDSFFSPYSQATLSGHHSGASDSPQGGVWSRSRPRILSRVNLRLFPTAARVRVTWSMLCCVESEDVLY